MSPKWIDREGLGKRRTETRQRLNYNWGENKRIAYRGGQPELRFACSFKIGICFSWSKRVKQKWICTIQWQFTKLKTLSTFFKHVKSPGYGIDLPLSRTGHHISQIKSSFELFCALVWNLEHFLTQNVNFSYSHYGFWGILHLFSHWQRLFLASKQRGLGILIVCTLCKTSYNALNHSHWGLGQFVGGRRGCSEKRDFRSLEAGISAFLISHHCTQVFIVYLSNRPHFLWVYRSDNPRWMLGEHKKSSARDLQAFRVLRR